MAGEWLEIEEEGTTRRVPLAPGLTRIGGGGAEVTLEGVGADQLHVWDDPPRAIFVGRGAPPSWNGRILDESPLRSGDRIVWGTRSITFRAAPAAEPPLLEEIPLGPGLAPAPGRPAVPGRDPAAPEERFLRRLQAGLFLELGIADRAAAKRWQEAVVDGRFDADACAHEILTRSLARTDDPRLLERSGRLLRDFLMAPLVQGVRGTGRRARQAARGGLAFLVAQAVALLVYSVIVLAALVLLRLRDFSLDEVLDRILLR